MGMKMWTYWLSYLIFDYVVYLLELLVVVVFLAVFLVDAIWDWYHCLLASLTA